MTRFKGFRNAFSKKNRIYSMEELLKMPMNEFFDREEELGSQDDIIGLPTNEELKNSPNVKFFDSYTDKNGVSFPSRWEAFTPQTTLTEPIKPFNTNNLTQQLKSTTQHSFPDLDKFQQEQLEKLEKTTQPVQTPVVQPTSQQTDINLDELMPDEVQAENSSVNHHLGNNKLTDLDSNIAPLLDEKKIDNKMYYVEPNQEAAKMSLLENKSKQDKNQTNFKDTTETPEQKTQEQQAQPQLSSNLTEYINELVGENIDYGFIGNKASTSSQPDLPIHPENGVIKGGISTTYNPEKDKDVMLKSGGYVQPTKASRDYNKIDETTIQFNDEQNKDRPDAKQMLEIGIYGVDSYDNNDQFTHIKDGSADIFNEKYKLTGNKTIPSNMKGIEFTKDSEFSKRVSENEDFQKTVKDAIEKNNGKMPDKVELDFNKDSNLNYSIGHGTLLNPKVTEDGYIEGVVFDKYDYNLLRKEYYGNYPATIYNNGAWGLQKMKHLEDYYYFIPIRFKY